MLNTNLSNNSANSVSFGYGKGTRELIKQVYPYCALTGKKYGGGPLAITTDHILSHHYNKMSKDSNYLFINQETNIEKKCTGLRKIIYKNPGYINNLANYFDYLLNSNNSKAQRYAKSALDTVLRELSGINSNLADRKIKVRLKDLEQ